MRLEVCLLLVLVCNATLGQDPTVPSAAILQRLQVAEQKPEIPSEDLPVIKLKAIILADSDHGSALLDIDGRRIRLRLERSEQTTAPDGTTQLDAVLIQGETFHVESFSNRSIILRSNKRTLLVH